MERTYTLTYPNLEELIQQTKYSKRGTTDLVDGFKGEVFVISSANPKIVEVFGAVRDIEIGPQFIRGKAAYRKENLEGQVVEGTSNSEISFRTTKNDNPQTNEALIRTLNEANIDWKNAEPPSPLAEYIPFLLPFLLLLTLAIFMMRKMNGLGSPMQFGRSRGKLYADEDIGVTFDDVAGIDEAVEEVREIVDFLQHPEKYQKLGGRIPKGVLLVGPPGTGKNVVGESDSRRGWRSILLPVRQRLRGDVCGCRGRSCSRHVSTSSS